MPPERRIVQTKADIAAVPVAFHGPSVEPGEPMHAGAQPASSVWWRWTAPISGTATLGTCGSSFYPLTDVYTGTQLSALREVRPHETHSLLVVGPQ